MTWTPRDKEAGRWYSLTEHRPYDDAFADILTELKSLAIQASVYTSRQERWSLSLRQIVQKYLMGVHKTDIEEYRKSRERPTVRLNTWAFSETYFDVAWDLVRRGVLVPARKHANENDAEVVGDTFLVTPHGLRWAEQADTTLASPIESDRFLEHLFAHRPRFGAIYARRCREATQAYRFALYMASLVMAGAAAESVMRAIAEEMAGGAEQLRVATNAHKNRQNLEKYVGSRVPKAVKDVLQVYSEPIKFWRDEAAHASENEFGELQAYTALLQLLRLAQLVDTRWDDFLGGNGERASIVP